MFVPTVEEDILPTMDRESTTLLYGETKRNPGGSESLSHLVGEIFTDAEASVSLTRLLLLNMFAFNYGLFYASVGVLLLPEEALRMFAGQHAIFLAVMLALAGISQLIR